MKLPPILKNFNLFVNGSSFLGEMASATLPKLARLTEDYRGGGMSGAAEIDMGMDKLTMELKPGGLIPRLLGQFGNPKIDGDLLRWVGAYQSDGDGQYTALEVYTRGRFKEFDLGSSEAGSKNEQTITYALTYIRILVNGIEHLEYQISPPIFRVMGNDRDAELRAILGA
jgi:hypothetical protein